MDLTNKKLSEETLWIIMSKDRKFIAKGTPRNREIVRMDDKKDKKRLLSYSTKGRAESGFKNNGFYGAHQLNPDPEVPVFLADLPKYLEAVEVKMTLTEIV